MPGPDGAEERFYRRRAVTPELRGLVTGLYAYTGGRPAPANMVHGSSLKVPFIVNLGAPYRIGLGREPGAADDWRSFASGLFAGPVRIGAGEGAACVQFNLRPLAARRLLRRPMSEFAGRLAGLDDLDDPEIAALPDRLAALGEWDDRLAFVERFLVARLLASLPPDREVAWAFHRIFETGGDLRTGALAQRLGWSRRKLVERFQRECGLPPKTIARIVRFNRAERMARDAAKPDWADIAAACGFADQAHLTREFVDLAGAPPTKARLTP